MYNVLGTLLGDPIISMGGQLMRFSSPGLVFIRGEALGAIYCISEQAALPLSKSRHPDSINTVIHLSNSGFWLLTGPVPGTGALQMGLRLAF